MYNEEGAFGIGLNTAESDTDGMTFTSSLSRILLVLVVDFTRLISSSDKQQEYSTITYMCLTVAIETLGVQV